MLNIFKITQAGPKKDGQDLLGLLIVQSSEDFYVVAPEPGLTPPRILADSNLINIHGKPLVKFKFPYHGHDWDLDVDDVSASEITGTWDNPRRPGEKPDEPEVWVASGTGRGVLGDDAGEEEARAATEQHRQ